MNLTPLTLRALTFFTLLVLATGCVSSPPPAPPSLSPSQKQHPLAPAQEKSIPPAEAVAAGYDQHPATCADARTIRDSERNRANCYRLQPAATVTKKKGQRPTSQAVKGTKKKGQKATGAVVQAKQKKGQKPTATKALAAKKKGKQTAKKGKTPPVQAATVPQREEPQTTGLCQPQSLIYTRCRTGIKTCTLGNTSPVQWFACARKNGATTSLPTAGSVMVLDGNSQRNMPTGHPVYVEEVTANENGTWTLRITHTNYDRKCHLDLDALVLFDPKQMTAAFQSGPWGPWAKDLKALGFILR